MSSDEYSPIYEHSYVNMDRTALIPKKEDEEMLWDTTARIIINHEKGNNAKKSAQFAKDKAIERVTLPLPTDIKSIPIMICVICSKNLAIDPQSPNFTPISSLACGHMIHNVCIHLIYDDKCPLINCRMEIDTAMAVNVKPTIAIFELKNLDADTTRVCTELAADFADTLKRNTDELLLRLENRYLNEKIEKISSFSNTDEIWNRYMNERIKQLSSVSDFPLSSPKEKIAPSSKDRALDRYESMVDKTTDDESWTSQKSPKRSVVINRKIPIFRELKRSKNTKVSTTRIVHIRENAVTKLPPEIIRPFRDENKLFGNFDQVSLNGRYFYVLHEYLVIGDGLAFGMVHSALMRYPKIDLQLKRNLLNGTQLVIMKLVESIEKLFPSLPAKIIFAIGDLETRKNGANLVFLKKKFELICHTLQSKGVRKMVLLPLTRYPNEPILRKQCEDVMKTTIMKLKWKARFASELITVQNEVTSMCECNGTYYHTPETNVKLTRKLIEIINEKE